MNPVLMKAILAMDSYNRGYGAGLGDNVNGLGVVGAKLGNATVLNVALPAGAQAAGFYAIAYDYNGEKVISYHGTDDLIRDPLHGYGVGAGSPKGNQAEMAFAFYNSVAGGGDPRTANISLTGHSLGGDLVH